MNRKYTQVNERVWFTIFLLYQGMKSYIIFLFSQSNIFVTQYVLCRGRSDKNIRIQLRLCLSSELTMQLEYYFIICIIIRRPSVLLRQVLVSGQIQYLLQKCDAYTGAETRINQVSYSLFRNKKLHYYLKIIVLLTPKSRHKIIPPLALYLDP